MKEPLTCAKAGKRYTTLSVCSFPLHFKKWYSSGQHSLLYHAFNRSQWASSPVRGPWWSVWECRDESGCLQSGTGKMVNSTCDDAGSASTTVFKCWHWPVMTERTGWRTEEVTVRVPALCVCVCWWREESVIETPGKVWESEGALGEGE